MDSAIAFGMGGRNYEFLDSRHSVSTRLIGLPGLSMKLSCLAPFDARRFSAWIIPSLAFHFDDPSLDIPVRMPFIREKHLLKNH